jgi:uncharacterized protein
MADLDHAYRAAAIVRDAGSSIVGRTKLQKIAYFLEVAGLGAGFHFRYKHYGPYSEQLASAARHASALKLITEQESVANWGGLYSTFHSHIPADPVVNPARVRMAKEMVNADAVELELAATALFLASEGLSDPWAETVRRKPDKADAGRLDKAKKLYQRLRAVETPHPLPAL